MPGEGAGCSLRGRPNRWRLLLNRPSAADGKKIGFTSNADTTSFIPRLLSNGTWTAPLNLTHCISDRLPYDYRI